MPTGSTGVGFVGVQTTGIGLNNFSVVKKEQAQFGGRHVRDESLGLIEGGA